MSVSNSLSVDTVRLEGDSRHFGRLLGKGIGTARVFADMKLCREELQRARTLAEGIATVSAVMIMRYVVENGICYVCVPVLL